MSDSMVAQTVSITGQNGDEVEAYHAAPSKDGARGLGSSATARAVASWTSYDDAGHPFFAVDRPAYRVAAANDGWERIAAFYTTHLGGWACAPTRQ